MLGIMCVRRDVGSKTTYRIPGTQYLFLKHQNRYKTDNEETLAYGNGQNTVFAGA